MVCHTFHNSPYVRGLGLAHISLYVRRRYRWNVRSILLIKLPEQEMSDQQYFRLAIGLSNIKIRKEYLLVNEVNPSQLGEANGGASRRSSEKQ